MTYTLFILIFCCANYVNGAYHLITYATPSHAQSADRLVKSAVQKGGFEYARSFSPADLEKSFKQRNKDILSNPRGAGYWIFKPHILMFYMTKIAQSDDVICYSDSMYEFLSTFVPIADTWLDNASIALAVNKPSEPSFLEIEWSKRDAFILIWGVDKSLYKESAQAWCGFVCLKNDFRALQWVAEWHTYVQDPRIVTDEPSIFSKEDTLFKENRHDQTVCSLLAKKYEVLMQHFPDGPVFNHHLFG